MSGVKSYLAVGILALACLSSLFYIKALKSENARLEDSLRLTINTNKQLMQNLAYLKAENEKALKLSFEASRAKSAENVRVQKVKEYIYKEVERGENNLTKLFNAMLDRLFE
ncbi:hypothetical protein [Campylobacter vulpis]|uniref:hypothetical protein n=1 Tax=Campylobacter vulpis TaxID=1655500 RepID=UPI000C158449|nr:hypothetical protein [Campylobacter vulpis]MBS4275655.1 hypothetical protein [Campylobacter vulpis]MBS4306865.1 hypothetical protein [Campylobacter vulpis]MBS4329012.1 hypothetical protein [Campylobacter vulpis]MBS4422811.1 hypothetical protein [Campylobacter vulpis]PHY89948.1 hypothetical protein AA995_07370 [Campylobacter vulpis]